MWKKKFGYPLNYFKALMAVRKNNPRTFSPQQNKKVVLTTAVYFQIFIPLRLPSFTKKGCFRYKTESVNTTIEFYIFELV